jgi:hypothetical protein
VWDRIAEYLEVHLGRSEDRFKSLCSAHHVLEEGKAPVT